MNWLAAQTHILNAAGQLIRWARRWSGGLLALLALALYVHTGSPGLMSGDQAEHQWVAHLVGVPHPTGYPLWTMTNALAVRLLPVSDAARPVTLMASIWAALAVWLLVRLVDQLTGSIWAGLLASGTLAVMREWWLLSTVADVYTLHVLLMLLVLTNLLAWWNRQPPGTEQAGWRHPLCRAAFFSGLGVTHHGSFGPIVIPGLLLTVVGPLLLMLRQADLRRPTLLLIGKTVLWGLAGCTPWLYLVAQFALFGPFAEYQGQGLPYRPYYGNPQTLGEVINLALGGGFRVSIFTHGWDRFGPLFGVFLSTLLYEFWWLVLLALPGWIWLARQQRMVAIWTAAVWLMAVIFGINVAAGVPKAHVYYLPALTMSALWIAVGAWISVQAGLGFLRHPGRRWSPAILAALLVGTVVRGLSLVERQDLAHNTLPRQIAQARLAAVPANAVILCRWEECMPLRFLQFVEGQQLSVHLDQSEPESGTNWADRAALYPTRPVFAVSFNQQLAERYTLRSATVFGDLWAVRK